MATLADLGGLVVETSSAGIVTVVFVAVDACRVAEEGLSGE